MSEETTPPSPPPPKIPPPSLPPPLPARPNKNVSQHSLQHSTMSSDDNLYDVENEPDGDDEISQQMTASYSEISFKSGLSPDTDIPLSLGLELEQIESMSLRDHVKSRPKTLTCDRPSNTSNPLGLGPLDLEGTVHVEGNMTHFVAEDLEYKIKLSSPVSKKGDTPPLPGHSRSGTPNTLYRQILAPQFVHIDSILLNELECEAQRLATSIDNLTENLCGILHSISSITADNVDVYKDAVSKMSDAMDSNIKSMYTIVAKAEEVTQAMKSVQAHAVQVYPFKSNLLLIYEFQIPNLRSFGSNFNIFSQENLFRTPSKLTLPVYQF